jgi:hypothetical protein
MTVAQLIESLKNYPSDLPVVVSGYEGGYNDVDSFENIKIVRDFNKAWYYGKHEDVADIYDEELIKNAVESLCVH